jgi:hypothetical protein
MLKTVHRESLGHECRSPRSKQFLSAFLTSGVSSTLNLYLNGPLLIRHATWQCWKGLWMPSGASKESRGDTVHWFFTPTCTSTFFTLNVAVFRRRGISAMHCTLLTWLQLTSDSFPELKNNSRSAGNTVKNWSEITLKNSRLPISAALKIHLKKGSQNLFAWPCMHSKVWGPVVAWWIHPLPQSG